MKSQIVKGEKEKFSCRGCRHWAWMCQYKNRKKTCEHYSRKEEKQDGEN